MEITFPHMEISIILYAIVLATVVTVLVVEGLYDFFFVKHRYGELQIMVRLQVEF